MDPLLVRQLKDIQLQAERLAAGSPEEEELELFSNYNEEIRDYILQNIEHPEVRALAEDIPSVLEIPDEIRTTPLALLIILGIITLGASALYMYYAIGMRRNRLIQNNIQIVRGKYGSIEFLLEAHA